MGKCRCVLLTLFSSASQFHRKLHLPLWNLYTIQDTMLQGKRSLKRKMFVSFLWFLKTIWILQQLNVLLKTSWRFFLVWRDNSPRKRRASVKVLFSAVNTWGLFKYKFKYNQNFLEHLSMNDIEYPFLKNMPFRNANSYISPVGANWKTSESQSINHVKFICNR